MSDEERVIESSEASANAMFEAAYQQALGTAAWEPATGWLTMLDYDAPRGPVTVRRLSFPPEPPLVPPPGVRPLILDLENPDERQRP